jgi:hypothetical protein
VGIPWKGGALVDGMVWPVADDDTIWLPAGRHVLEAAGEWAGPRLLRLNAELKGARAAGASSVEFSYESNARAIAILSRKPARVEVDGVIEAAQMCGPHSVLLPRGQHVVTITTE